MLLATHPGKPRTSVYARLNLAPEAHYRDCFFSLYKSTPKLRVHASDIIRHSVQPLHASGQHASHDTFFVILRQSAWHAPSH